MNQIVLTVRVGADGVLQLDLGKAEANREVRITIEPISLSVLESDQEYLEFLRTTAGAWQGDFERPEQGNYEVREKFA